MSEIPIEILDPSHPVGAIINPSRLGYLRHFDAGRNSHKELLGALAERWWDTTNTFHFSWGEMTMTPVDFSVITGIPFDLPRIVGPGSAIPALSVSRRWLYLQAPGIYARHRRGELTATQVARFTLLLMFASTFWSNRKERFNPSILKSLENLAHLTEYDWAGAILSRMYDDMCGLSRSHCKLSGTYYFWEIWAFEYFPYTRPEQIHADLGLGLVPLAWRWYRTNLHTSRHKHSLKDLRTFFDTCSPAQVEVGAMAIRLQSWIQVDPHFQRSDDLSRRRVILSHPVLRRYYLGERVDFQIRGCRSIPYPPPGDMRAGRQMTLTDAHTEGIPYGEFILEGDYAEFCRLFLMQPIGSRLDNFQRSAPFHPPATRSSRAAGSSSRTPKRRPTTDPSSSTRAEGSSQAGPSHSAGHSRAPRAVTEATGSLHSDLANLRLPYSISYHTDHHMVRPSPNPAGIQTSPEYRSWFMTIVWPVEKLRRNALLSVLEGWTQADAGNEAGIDEEVLLAPQIGNVGESSGAKDDSEDVAPRRRRGT
ncbi:hypothetical protein JCGZ_03753 [Jatropha curcas]|uniref:Aminotransferase-like plant mobile domain-containing protein n=1 Tax=Jatropha curcas TaxID=180498 RepID=A0A067JA50_JATCU|nr:hypothetical protein JCGZ_03753 [Jatropha curcas]